ncbi:MAG TPA: toxin [Candidatus Poseidoniales archaeon]|nr:MAG TPA: toxin [Candidatus Poseidoniales archaeon]|tara:strand:+ start:986 stop:1549 length:564 start_codon:yes stop_codon:yes gene_type:complete
MFNSSLRLVAFMSMQPRVIALTGSPGTGKTTLALRLQKEGLSVIKLEEAAESVDALSQFEDSREVDISKLGEWEWEGDSHCVIDGHLSHHCPIDAVIVLRCNPIELRRRLEQRTGYGPEKIESNVEWELISGVWADLISVHPRVDVIEIDTTEQDVSIGSVLDFILNGKPSTSVEEYISDSIDWIAP